jgi:hypothetical protein
MIGSSALACVERSLVANGERRAKRVIKVTPALPRDVLPARMCRRCGFAGLHGAPEACIDALRSEIAGLEFKLEEAESRLRERAQETQMHPEPPPAPAPPSQPDIVPGVSVLSMQNGASHNIAPKQEEKRPTMIDYSQVLADLQERRAALVADLDLTIHTIEKFVQDEAPRPTKSRTGTNGSVNQTQTVLEFLQTNAPKAFDFKAVAAGTGLEEERVGKVLISLYGRKKIARPRRGKYCWKTPASNPPQQVSELETEPSSSAVV